MTDQLYNIGVGGLLALLIIREVLAFATKAMSRRRNGAVDSREISLRPPKQKDPPSLAQTATAGAEDTGRFDIQGRDIWTEHDRLMGVIQQMVNGGHVTPNDLQQLDKKIEKRLTAHEKKFDQLGDAFTEFRVEMARELGKPSKTA